MSSYVRRSVRVAVAQVALLVVVVLGAGGVLGAARHLDASPAPATVWLVAGWPVLSWVPLAWVITLVWWDRRPATGDASRVVVFWTGLLLIGLELGLLAQGVLLPLLRLLIPEFHLRPEE